jgi:transcriptional regulator with XRE-family HTH domain
MIRNEKQYKITRAQAEAFRGALSELMTTRSSVPSDPAGELKWKLQEGALRGQLADLDQELKEYENLRENRLEALELGDFEELPDILVKARIAAGLTQKQLAEKLGWKEQQVQRYEATAYGGASLQRIEGVMQALGVRLRKQVFVPAQPISPAVIFDRMRDLGFSNQFIATKLLSPKLRASLDRKQRPSEIEGLVFSSAARISKIFNWDLPQFFTSPGPLPLDRTAVAHARFKLTASTSRDKVSAYTVYAHYLALLLLQATRDVLAKPIPASWRHIRSQINSRYGEIALHTIVKYMWDLGVIILPLKDAGQFHAATWRIRGRSVIVLKQTTQSEARWIIDLLHELWHAMQSPELPEYAVIEGDALRAATEDEQIEEQVATDFAADVVFQGRAEELAEECAVACARRTEWLKSAVQKVAARNHVRVDLLANYLAYRMASEGENWWPTASKLQGVGREPWQEVRDFVIGRIKWDALAGGDRELLSLALQGEA